MLDFNGILPPTPGQVTATTELRELADMSRPGVVGKAVGSLLARNMPPHGSLEPATKIIYDVTAQLPSAAMTADFAIDSFKSAQRQGAPA